MLSNTQHWCRHLAVPGNHRLLPSLSPHVIIYPCQMSAIELSCPRMLYSGFRIRHRQTKRPTVNHREADSDHQWWEQTASHKAGEPLETYVFLSLSFLMAEEPWRDCRVSAATFLLLKEFISSSKSLRFSSRFLFSSWWVRFSISNLSCS